LIVTALRKELPRGPFRKVLLVIDQFEQWLQANSADAECQLISALRQCDGEQVQCIVMVRDDFWLALSRFMKACDVPLIQGQNAALVDLFDPFHARNVLMSFGRSFGRLPDKGELSKDQAGFIDRAMRSRACPRKAVSFQCGWPSSGKLFKPRHGRCRR
jgi:hypothetical protein